MRRVLLACALCAAARASEGALDAPAVLDRPGATYRLARDVTADGTAFTITAADVTLDLGGHTVRYDGGPGVLARGAGGTVTIRNGRIVQAGNGARSPAVLARECGAVVLQGLTVAVSGPDCDGLAVVAPKGGVRITQCAVACRTSVVSNRHYPGVAAIRVAEQRAGAEVDHNTVTASPQWGILLHSGRAGGPSRVYRNVVRGTKALVANGYMLGIHVPDADVFENLLTGESRGIHVEGEKARGARVHENAIEAQDQRNPEYPQKHWVHGIKVEEAPDCRVYGNRVVAIADRDHAEAFAIDISCGTARGIEVFGNRVTALARDDAWPAHALHWSVGPDAPGAAVVHHNVFEASDTGLLRGWSSGASGLLHDNWWRALTDRFTGEAFRVSDKRAAGGRIVDAWGPADLSTAKLGAGAGPCASTREASVKVRVRGAAAGTPVELRDRDGGVAWRGVTDGDGWAAGTVVTLRIANGPSVTDPNPFTLAAGACTAPVGIRGRAAFLVEGDAVARDATAPPAPGALRAEATGAGVVALGWTAPADESGIAGYLVTVDGEAAGCTAACAFSVAGLAPERAYRLAVQAVDAGGNLGPAAEAEARTGPEDRGQAPPPSRR